MPRNVVFFTVSWIVILARLMHKTQAHPRSFISLAKGEIYCSVCSFKLVFLYDIRSAAVMRGIVTWGG